MKSINPTNNMAMQQYSRPQVSRPPAQKLNNSYAGFFTIDNTNSPYNISVISRVGGGGTYYINAGQKAQLPAASQFNVNAITLSSPYDSTLTLQGNANWSPNDTGSVYGFSLSPPTFPYSAGLINFSVTINGRTFGGGYNYSIPQQQFPDPYVTVTFSGTLPQPSYLSILIDPSQVIVPLTINASKSTGLLDTNNRPITADFVMTSANVFNLAYNNVSINYQFKDDINGCSGNLSYNNAGILTGAFGGSPDSSTINANVFCNAFGQQISTTINAGGVNNYNNVIVPNQFYVGTTPLSNLSLTFTPGTTPEPAPTPPPPTPSPPPPVPVAAVTITDNSTTIPLAFSGATNAGWSSSTIQPSSPGNTYSTPNTSYNIQTTLTSPGSAIYTGFTDTFTIVPNSITVGRSYPVSPPTLPSQSVVLSAVFSDNSTYSGTLLGGGYSVAIKAVNTSANLISLSIVYSDPQTGTIGVVNSSSTIPITFTGNASAGWNAATLQPSTPLTIIGTAPIGNYNLTSTITSPGSATITSFTDTLNFLPTSISVNRAYGSLMPIVCQSITLNAIFNDNSTQTVTVAGGSYYGAVTAATSSASLTNITITYSDPAPSIRNNLLTNVNRPPPTQGLVTIVNQSSLTINCTGNTSVGWAGKTIVPNDTNRGYFLPFTRPINYDITTVVSCNGSTTSSLFDDIYVIKPNFVSVVRNYENPSLTCQTIVINAQFDDESSGNIIIKSGQASGQVQAKTKNAKLRYLEIDYYDPPPQMMNNLLTSGGNMPQQANGDSSWVYNVGFLPFSTNPQFAFDNVMTVETLTSNNAIVVSGGGGYVYAIQDIPAGNKGINLSWTWTGSRLNLYNSPSLTTGIMVNVTEKSLITGIYQVGENNMIYFSFTANNYIKKGTAFLLQPFQLFTFSSYSS
jgi:hypothetical protein